MKYRVADLDGALLDAAVALADGRLLVDDEPKWPKGDYLRLREEYGGRHVVRWYVCAAEDGDGPETEEIGGWEPIDNWGLPSTDWEMGGPIIERERITVRADFSTEQPGEWAAMCKAGGYGEGPTFLIAAMRAYVASKLGDEVELP